MAQAGLEKPVDPDLPENSATNFELMYNSRLAAVDSED